MTTTTMSLLQGLFTHVLANRVAALGDPAAIRVLFDLNSEGDTCKLLAMAISIGTTSLLLLRTQVLPRWLSRMGLGLSPALVVASWSFALTAPTQYTAYAVLLFALLVWVTALSVLSFRRASR